MSHVSQHNTDTETVFKSGVRATYVRVSVTVAMVGVHIETVITLTVGIVTVVVTGGSVGGLIVTGARVGGVTVTVTVELLGISRFLESKKQRCQKSN